MVDVSVYATDQKESRKLKLAFIGQGLFSSALAVLVVPVHAQSNANYLASTEARQNRDFNQAQQLEGVPATLELSVGATYSWYDASGGGLLLPYVVTYRPGFYDVRLGLQGSYSNETKADGSSAEGMGDTRLTASIKNQLSNTHSITWSGFLSIPAKGDSATRNYRQQLMASYSYKPGEVSYGLNLAARNTSGALSAGDSRSAWYGSAELNVPWTSGCQFTVVADRLVARAKASVTTAAGRLTYDLPKPAGSNNVPTLALGLAREFTQDKESTSLSVTYRRRF